MKVKKVVVLYTKMLFNDSWTESIVTVLVNELKRKKFNVELVSIPFSGFSENAVYDSMLVWKLLNLSSYGDDDIDLVISTGFPNYGIVHSRKVLWLMQSSDILPSIKGDEENCRLEVLDNKAKMKKKLNDFEKRNLNEFDKVFTITQNIADYVIKQDGMLGNVLYHPPCQSNKYYCHGFNKYILSVGESNLLKQNEMLLKALLYCKSDIRAKIVVKEKDAIILEKLALALNLKDRVDFFVDITDHEQLDLYANAGAVYYASQSDDYGYSVLKAFYSRKPVVACSDSGIGLEFIEDTKNGYICESQDGILGKKIEMLMENPKMCECLGRCGYDKVSEISWEQVINKLTEGI